VSDFAVGGVGLYGTSFTCAIALGGEVFCWGSNTTGVMGADLTSETTTPQRVGAVDDAVEISCGAHCCIRRSDDSVACWGGPNEYGQIGDGTTVPVYEPATVIPPN